MMRTEHRLSRGSSRVVSLRSHPSVTYRILVTPGLYVDANRTEYPTNDGSDTSLDTRSASVVAAIRRGCVHTTSRPPSDQPFSCRYCGSWVDLPHPVSPTSTTTPRVSRARRIRVRWAKMGSARRSGG